MPHRLFFRQIIRGSLSKRDKNVQMQINGSIYMCRHEKGGLLLSHSSVLSAQLTNRLITTVEVLKTLIFFLKTVILSIRYQRKQTQTFFFRVSSVISNSSIAHLHSPRLEPENNPRDPFEARSPSYC